MTFIEFRHQRALITLSLLSEASKVVNTFMVPFSITAPSELVHLTAEEKDGKFVLRLIFARELCPYEKLPNPALS